jgi:hypothetical protein
MPTLAALLDATDAPDPPGVDYARRRPFMVAGRVRRVRRIPAGGEALVTVGEAVDAGAPVARGWRSGRATAIDVAGALGIGLDREGEVGRHLVRTAGEEVAEGESLAERRALGGLQRRAVRVPFTGRLEHVSEQTGVAYVVPPAVESVVRAHLGGRVTEVSPTSVTVEGTAFVASARAGAGPVATGPLVVVSEIEQLPPDAAGSVVACGFALDQDAVRRLIDCGAAAIVAPSVDEDAIDRLGWADAFWPRAGGSPVPPVTVVALSFSPSAPAGLWEALRSLAGRTASVVGREEGAEASTPEVVIALGENAPSLYGLPERGAGSDGEASMRLAPGARVRVIAGRGNGLVGEIVALSPGPYRLRSEVGAEVAEVVFPFGVRLRVPLLHLQAMP